MNPLDFILHINDHLAVMIETYGVWVYAILFLIVFAETGLVVTPFLPGDSLLFAVGALAASTGKLDPVLCGVIVIAAAFCGDNVNYWIGRTLGPRVFRFEDSIFFNRKHLERTEQFYNKYGTRAVIIARFVPIVRTFAPFVAGIGKMPTRATSCSVASAHCCGRLFVLVLVCSLVIWKLSKRILSW
jgi:membrane-associated protein